MESSIIAKLGLFGSTRFYGEIVKAPAKLKTKEIFDWHFDWQFCELRVYLHEIIYAI